MKLLTTRKMLLSLAASIIFSLSASADDVITFRVVADNGTVKEFALDEVNRLTFQEETFTMIFNTDAADEQFRYEDVLNMHFGTKSTTAVQNVAEDAALNISYDGSFLRIEGIAEPSVLRVYDISGRPVMSQRVNGQAEISTEQLSAGVYILKINNRTFKFSKL